MTEIRRAAPLGDLPRSRSSHLRCVRHRSDIHMNGKSRIGNRGSVKYSIFAFLETATKRIGLTVRTLIRELDKNQEFTEFTFSFPLKEMCYVQQKTNSDQAVRGVTGVTRGTRTPRIVMGHVTVI